MRALVAMAMLVGCGSDDVRLLGGHWGVTSTKRNVYMEGTMYVKQREGGVALNFIEVDVDPPRGDGRNGVYCSDFDTTIERMERIELSDRALAQPGTVPVMATFDPSVPSAWITMPGAMHDMGTIELTEVGDTLVGSFTATGLYYDGVAVTSMGTFNARSCD